MTVSRASMNLSSGAWTKEYERRGALWTHDGNRKRPHALLTSGDHSNGFFNSGLVAQDPSLLSKAAEDLVELLSQSGMSIHIVDRVVGPAMGAITLAHELARHIGMQRNQSTCLTAYVEKLEGVSPSHKKMVFNRTRLEDGERILCVEDVLTTGGSVDLTAAAVVLAGGIVLPFIPVLVNRSGLEQIGDRKIVALINSPMQNWSPSDCPLCAVGSEAIKPKQAGNWARLTAAYD